jgi:hypothetical protein
MFYKGLPADYQKRVVEKWAPVIDAGGRITDQYKRAATAIILENTQNDSDKQASNFRALIESYGGLGGGSATSQGAQTLGSDGGGAFGAYGDFETAGLNPNDARLPSIVIPTVRRIFPELIAHDIVGVQPMTQSVGWAFALRFNYGPHGNGGVVSPGDEIGYNNMDAGFTGASGEVLSGDMWNAYAGSAMGKVGFGGTAADLAASEWWNIGEDMPMVQFEYLKTSVEAKTRKIAAAWSQELAEDMKNAQGTDINAEMLNAGQYEIKAEIDRQLISEIVKATIKGSNFSTWTPVTADGRNQRERIQTLLTHISAKSQRLAIQNRMGAANWMVTSPLAVALLEQLQYLEAKSRVDVNPQSIGVAKVGKVASSGITVYRDTFAGGDYILMGYKGPNPQSTGIVFCPYIPLQIQQAVDPNNFNPRVGLRTRYGIVSSLFGAENFSHFIRLADLTSQGLASDDSGDRVFMA